jgi:hypothetical protein
LSVRLCDKLARADTCQQHHHEQRPQAELKPAALAFRWIGFGRLGLHGRIILDRGQPGQAIIDPLAIASRRYPPSAPVGSFLGIAGWFTSLENSVLSITGRLILHKLSLASHGPA